MFLAFFLAFFIFRLISDPAGLKRSDIGEMTMMEGKTFDKRARALAAALQEFGAEAEEGVEFALEKGADKRWFWTRLEPIIELKAKDKVFDVNRPDVHGVVVVAGSNVSEVRWDTPECWGKTSNALNKHLRFVVDQPDPTPSLGENVPLEEGIPEFLQVKNRVPLTPEQEARLTEIQQQVHETVAKLDPTLPRHIEPAGLEILHEQQQKSLKKTVPVLNADSDPESGIATEEDIGMSDESVENVQPAKKARKTRVVKARIAKAPKAPKVVKAAKAPKVAKKTNGTSTRGEKTKEIGRLLQRKNGCTTEEILELTGWPAVSVPAMAKACGLKLRKERQPGERTRYWGE
jgi:hypothetical protein